MMVGDVPYDSTLSPNGSISGSISFAGENDVYRIDVPGPGTLSVHSTGTTDTYGHLLNSLGEELITDDNGGEQYNFSLSYSVSQGAYYLKVRHYSASGTGDYGIVSNFTPSSPDDSTDNGNGITCEYTVSTSSTTATSINPSGDVDIFCVTITNRGTLTVQSGGFTDTYGYLLDSTGDELFSDNDNGVNNNFIFGRTVDVGTYYIKVRHNDPSGTGNYSLTIQFSTTPPLTDIDEDEDGLTNREGN